MYDAINHGWLKQTAPPAQSACLHATAACRRRAHLARRGASRRAAARRTHQPGAAVLPSLRAGPQRGSVHPGWPYSFVAALETGRTSWTAVLDAIRLGPADDATAVTAIQLREVVPRLVGAGQWQPGDADILVLMDTGYDVTRLAYVLADLPVELVGRLRSDRIMVRDAGPRRSTPRGGQPRKHGGVLTFSQPASWHHDVRHHSLRHGRNPRLGPDAPTLAGPRSLARPLTGSSWNPVVEVNAVSGGDRVDQGLELGGRVLVRPGSPPSVQGGGGGEPCAE
ncbi:hypothetical protein RKD20_000045 [Streptomyces sp. SLBN-8D4]